MIGILALQGDFHKHASTMEAVGAKTLYVKTPEDLKQCVGLIIPGGESTAIYRQMQFINMIQPLKDFAKTCPVFGTCAGLILMSKEIVSEEFVKPLGIMDLVVERNAFGRQSESFSADFQVSIPENTTFTTTAFFIRAPRIRQTSDSIRVLATYDNEPILVQQGLHLGATFHPELTAETRIHKYFYDVCKKNLQ